ncbi:uncharacterized protein LDX57_007714 [Aspergillus melleus]|uniref:Uncharacterized protein n=1 Tax=Aspergillus steynii IBT 23096 TaxID=1392250 RepID=A0A2I2G5Q8_9EURO|nr:uncharacterized protein P170DRAFT_437885 [Aspergillus steynii IBT 23096]XP_045945401.1 uncharacterized protein LDX57_007714 [Aspergillus melleus]KAH8430043.1 hypothetical protein LDX57_007714 [Aspergillus melleus]PLB48204.1 hypothetical protein P170DRAFT_437885 [Aspergillus steynii IBT 23096]
MAHPVNIQEDRASPASCELNANDSTPPEQRNFPLTPPPTGERQTQDASTVERVLRTFKDLRSSCPTSLPLTVKLKPVQYSRLLGGLTKDPDLKAYVNDKVRWEFDAKSEQLDVRMPTPVHDIFVTSIAGEIDNQLQRVVDVKGPASKFAAQIVSGGSSRILLRTDTTEDDQLVDSDVCLWRQPDAQFQHSLAAYPGVVLEVSYSQDGKNLQKLARDYIMHSNGNIKVVIGIDVTYEGKESTLSLWRASYTPEEGEDYYNLDVMQEVKSEIFRTRDGCPTNTTKSIRVCLADFGPDEISGEYEAVVISLSYDTLLSLLTRAEQVHIARESASDNRGVESKRKIRKRKLPSSSPAEQLRSDDEAEHQRQEMQAEERAAAADDDFELPSSRRRRLTG